MGDDKRDDLLGMQLTRRQMLAAGLAVPAGAAFLAACQAAAPASTAPGSAAATTAAAGSVPATSPTPAITASGTPRTDFTGVTLTAWSGGTTAGPAKNAAAEWEKKTGGKVDVITVPFAERELKFAGLIAAQDATVDLLYAGGQFVGRFGDRLYEDLEAMGVDKAPYVPAIIPILSSGGKLRGVPQHSEMELYIYNKAMFAAAGADPNNIPGTWDELYALAPKLTQGDRYPAAVPWLTSLGTSAAYWLVIFNSQPGAELLSEDRMSIKFDNDMGLKAWQVLDRGFKAKFFDPNLDATIDDYGTGKLFNEGKTASQINFAELWGYAVGGDPENFPTTLKPEDVGVRICPGIEAGQSGSINGFEGFGISKFSKNKDAALSFLQYMGGTEFQKAMNLTKVLPSSRSDVLNDAEVKAAYPIGAVLAEQGKFNLNRYAAPYDWTPPFTTAIAALLKGEMTPEQAHESTVNAVKLIITNYQVG